jgi:hypothetical protein
MYTFSIKPYLHYKLLERLLKFALSGTYLFLRWANIIKVSAWATENCTDTRVFDLSSCIVIFGAGIKHGLSVQRVTTGPGNHSFAYIACSIYIYWQRSAR